MAESRSEQAEMLTLERGDDLALIRIFMIFDALGGVLLGVGKVL